jgi:hypothetical protein
MVSPYDQIAALYGANPQEFTFDFYVAWHHRHGFVFSTPDYFVMGRPVIRERIVEMTDVMFELTPELRRTADTWFVHAMAGDIGKCWQILPWPLGWIAFHRLRGGKKELTLVPSETLRRLCPADLPAIDDITPG